MKKGIVTGILLATCVLIFAACGITEELDQSKETVAHLKQNLEKQEKNYRNYQVLVDTIDTVFKDDQEAVTDEKLPFTEQEGSLYKNYKKREKLLQSMEKVNTDIQNTRKQLEKIVQQKSVDVPNNDLKHIAESLEIMESNFSAYEAFIKTANEQETRLYDNYPVDDLEVQRSIIKRTYGSVSLVTEESEANISYTLNLIDSFQKSTATTSSQKK